MAGLLRKLRQELTQIVSPTVRHDLAVEASRMISQKLQGGFDSKRDPYGVPWAPRKHADIGSLMDRTGALRSGLMTDATPKRITVRVTGPAKRYAGFHMTGTRRMPRRRFMPDGDIPQAWKQALSQLSDNYFTRRWGR